MLGLGAPLRYCRMGKIIELPDELYRDLERVARERGLTPAGWIATTLSGGSDAVSEQPLSELLRDLIGSVDSSKEPGSAPVRMPFIESIARKFEKQGLRRR